MSSFGPINLDRAFTKGEVKLIHLVHADEGQVPPQGRRWLILAGKMVHTATIGSMLFTVPKDLPATASGEVRQVIRLFDASAATGIYPLFDAWQPVIIDREERLFLFDQAASDAWIKVLEW
jgi:hypothetical protein